MSKQPYKPRPAGTLKAAISQLITDQGGYAMSCAKTIRPGKSKPRISSTQLQRCADSADEFADIWPALDVIVMIEDGAPVPYVTEWMARAVGCILLPVQTEGDIDGLNGELATIAERIGQLFRDYHHALDPTDDTPLHLDEPERRRLLATVEEGLRALARAHGRLSRGLSGVRLCP